MISLSRSILALVAASGLNQSYGFCQPTAVSVVPWRDNSKAYGPFFASARGIGTIKEGTDEWITRVPDTLPEALRVFFLDKYNGPRIIVSILSVLTAVRLWIDDPLSTLDIGVAAGALVVWWFQEHLLHKYLLHSPFHWYGREIHEGHHAKPYFHISIDPAGLMLGWLGVAHLVLRWLLPWPLALSATLGYASAGLWYEYLHFIVHTKVHFRRKSYLERMKAHHARHHLVDSRFWLGFSVPAIDTLFRTNPSPSSVKTDGHAMDRRTFSANRAEDATKIW